MEHLPGYLQRHVEITDPYVCQTWPTQPPHPLPAGTEHQSDRHWQAFDSGLTSSAKLTTFVNDPDDIPAMAGRLQRCAGPMRRTVAAQAAASRDKAGSDKAWAGTGPLPLGRNTGTPIRPSLEREVP
ncbi:hypothetical protein [Streptomyces sp. NPDC096311]|uniref:hypothetical protein n=1 Tax=Streptomyces sp. NPDC096311 TaxID=3366083 RepID=UPI00380EE02D